MKLYLHFCPQSENILFTFLTTSDQLGIWQYGSFIKEFIIHLCTLIEIP